MSRYDGLIRSHGRPEAVAEGALCHQVLRRLHEGLAKFGVTPTELASTLGVRGSVVNPVAPGRRLHAHRRFTAGDRLRATAGC